MNKEELIQKLEDFEVKEAVLPDKYFSNAQEKAAGTDYQETIKKLSREYPETTQKLPLNCPETTQKILLAILDNPHITAGDLAKKVGISKAGIWYNLNRLKKDKVLKRVGPDRGGRWEVVGHAG